MKVRQLVRGARRGDGDRARRIETEEPDAGIASVAMHVGAHVDLVKRRHPRQRRHADGTDAGERERDEADVGDAVERVDGQLRRDERLQLLRRDFPMQKKEVMPVLPHQRRLIGLKRRSDAVDGVNGGHAHRLKAKSRPVLESAGCESSSLPPRSP